MSCKANWGRKTSTKRALLRIYINSFLCYYNRLAPSTKQGDDGEAEEVAAKENDEDEETGLPSAKEKTGEKGKTNKRRAEEEDDNESMSERLGFICCLYELSTLTMGLCHIVVRLRITTTRRTTRKAVMKKRTRTRRRATKRN